MIEDWMPALKAVMEAVPGIRDVRIYNELPGSILRFPALIILPKSGSQSYGASGAGIAIHQVQMTLYLTNQVLPEAYDQTVPFVGKIRAALAANSQLHGKVSYCLPVDPPADWYEGPGSVSYGSKDHVGVIFHLKVKENETILVS